MRERLSFDRSSIFVWPVCQIQSADFNFRHVSSVTGGRAVSLPLIFAADCSTPTPARTPARSTIWVFDGDDCIDQQLEIASSLAGVARAVLFTSLPEYHQTQADIQRLKNITLETSGGDDGSSRRLLPRPFLPPIVYLAKRCPTLELAHREFESMNSTTAELTWSTKSLLEPTYGKVSIDMINNEQWIYLPRLESSLGLSVIIGTVSLAAFEILRRVRRRGRESTSRKHYILIPLIIQAALSLVLSWIYGNDLDSIFAPLLMLANLFAHFFSYLLMLTYIHYAACGVGVTSVVESLERESSRMYLSILFSTFASMGATATNPIVAALLTVYVIFSAEIARRNLKFLHIKAKALSDVVEDQVAGDSPPFHQEEVDYGIGKAIRFHRLNMMLDILWASSHLYAHCYRGNHPKSPIVIFAANLVLVVGKIITEVINQNRTDLIFHINHRFHELSRHDSRKVLRAGKGVAAADELCSKHSSHTVLFISPETDRGCPVHGLAPPSRDARGKGSDVKMLTVVKNYLKNVFLNQGPVNLSWFESGVADAVRVRRAGSIRGAMEFHQRRLQQLIGNNRPGGGRYAPSDTIVRGASPLLEVINPFDPDELEMGASESVASEGIGPSRHPVGEREDSQYFSLT